MALDSFKPKITWPISISKGIELAKERYQLSYALIEAVRLKHNTRNDDLSADAQLYRQTCLGILDVAIDEMLKLRPTVRSDDTKNHALDPDWVDPELVKLKAEGKAAHKTTDIKTMTDVDLDKLEGEPEPFKDPLEDFAADYTEVDTGGYLTVAQYKITVTDLPANVTSYVYKAHSISGDFEHHVTEKYTVPASQRSGRAAFWGVSQNLGTWNTNYSADVYGLYAFVLDLGINHQIYIRECKNAGADTSGSTSAVTDYCVCKRVSTTYSVLIYTDAAHTSLFDTISTSDPDGSAHDMSYVYGAAAYGIGSALCSFEASNLDLQEATDVIIGPFINPFASPFKGGMFR